MTLQRTLSQSQLFLARLGYKSDEPIEIRAIKKLPDGKSSVEGLWTTPDDFLDESFMGRLGALNSEGYSIYVGINTRRGNGLTGDDNITHAKAYFADFDFKEEEFAGWTRNQKHAYAQKAFSDAALPWPTLIICSGNGIHIYWVFSERSTNLDGWKAGMENLIAAIGCDKTIKNAERIMRGPGWANTKQIPYLDCEIIDDTKAVFSFDEITSKIAEAAKKKTGSTEDSAKPKQRHVPAEEIRENRNVTLTQDAGKFVKDNPSCTFEELRSYLINRNKFHCIPPLLENEVFTIAESAMKWPRPEKVEPADGKLPIVIGTDEHRVADETIRALMRCRGLFHRAGILARVVEDDERNDGILRPRGSRTISPVTEPWLREQITLFAALKKVVHKKDAQLEEPAHPPAWLTPAIISRESWPSLRRLEGVSDAPVLRPDGTIHQTPGYDNVTGVLYAPSGKFPAVPEKVFFEDAVAACVSLKEVFADFPFESEEHRAAAVSGILTVVGRHAFSGPPPIFLWDANTKAAGKTLGCQASAEIVLGRSMPVMGYAHDSTEFEKRITALAVAGDSMVLLDNIPGVFGNDALDRATTAEHWEARILGTSKLLKLPLLMTWFATGNNIMVEADTSRRIIHIRLNAMTLKPEERCGFKHPDLLGWIRQNRGPLLASALTVLSGYIQAGRPQMQLPNYGGFEGWSALVRSAVVWCGMSDPGLTRAKLSQISDTTGDNLGQLSDAVRNFDPDNQGFTMSDAHSQLYGSLGYQDDETVEVQNAMRSALEALAGSLPGKPPSVKALGYKMRSIRRRVFDSRGAYFDIDSEQNHRNGAVWKLFGLKESVRPSISRPAHVVADRHAQLTFGE